MARIDLSNTVYEILLNRIITYKYQPGQMLNELSLHEELNVSRTPIHTAMVMLQQENLVEILPKKGIRVTDVTADTIRDTYDLRELLELNALRTYGHNFDKNRILHYYHAFKENYTEDRYEEVFSTDVQFHQEIVELTRNRLLCSYYSSLKNQFIRLSNASGRGSERRVGYSNDEHLAVLTALLNDDVEGAVRALAEHLRKGREIAYRVIILHDNTPNE